MFTKIFKPHLTKLLGAILIGALVLIVPAGTAKADAPTPTPLLPQVQPAGQGKATPANLENAYQKELQALKTQDNNLTKVDTILGKADTFLTLLKNKGRDVDILQTILGLFKQDLATATGFHDKATQILNAHAGFDNNGIVIDQAQALVTVRSARDKLVEARLTLKGGIADVRQAVQLYRKGKTANPQSSPNVSPTPTAMPTQ
jgi:hypothetical protein